MFSLVSRSAGDGERVGGHVYRLTALHAPHLRAHDPAHHPEVPIPQLHGCIDPELGDGIQLLARDWLHQLASAEYRSRAVLPPRGTRDPLLRRRFPLAV